MSPRKKKNEVEAAVERARQLPEHPDNHAPNPVPRISVLDRRLNNPFGQPSFDIPLKGEKRGWVVRTFAADAEHPNRHYDAVHRLAWVPLSATDLTVSPESLGFNVAPDGRIIRGRHGEEVLMAMPKEDWEKVQAAKSEENERRLKPKKLRDATAQATAKEHGDEAGDMTYRNYSQKDVVGPLDAA